MNLYLPDQLIEIHNTFDKSSIPHAFGGAIALAYYGEPRATRDIDINIFLASEQHSRVLDSLSSLFPISNRDEAELQLIRTAQTRLKWGEIPIDLFFSNLPFHEAAATRRRTVDFVGVPIPILSAEDLIICKAAYNRTRHWLDIENTFKIQRQDLDERYLKLWLDEFFEPDDNRIRKIEGYIRDYGSSISPEKR